jgi:glyoxylase-like metal-dependent hydrolase (beta-lactamase superfamily II)
MNAHREAATDEMLELRQAKGNTWYLAGWQLIPLYRVGENQCILLDSGLLGQRRSIQRVLAANNLTPIGILGTHAHTDHSPNHGFFRETYGIPVAMPVGETGLCATPLNLKSYFFMLSPQQSREEEDVAQMMVQVDRVIQPWEEKITFCGVEFDIIHTPGHSPDHIAIRTPDGVLYVGDALLAGEELKAAKLPYFFSHQDAMDSMEKLRGEKASCYLVAHRGIYREIGPVVDANKAAILARAEEIRRLIDRPMTLSEIQSAVCEHFFLLTGNVSRAALYERNVRIYIDYLRDTRQVEVFAKRGMVYYAPKKEKEESR